jgi:thiol:disulfide interchange protein DsbD
MKRPLFAFILVAVAGIASAKPWWMRGIESNESDFLPPDVAFRASASADGNTVRIRWIIADGYYLYRNRIEIAAQSPDLTISAPVMPQGMQKTDPYLGTQEIYRQQAEVSAAYSRSDAGAHPMQIKVTYQGCADAGLCYPPISKVLFPERAAPPAPSVRHPWEGVAIIGGGIAFLLAGFTLRKDRRLELPAA